MCLLDVKRIIENQFYGIQNCEKVIDQMTTKHLPHSGIEHERQKYFVPVPDYTRVKLNSLNWKGLRARIESVRNMSKKILLRRPH